MPFPFLTRHSALVSLRTATTFFALLVVLITLAAIAYTQNVAPAPNSDPAYQTLRNLTLSGEAVNVTNFELKRDAGTFHLHSGTVCFTTPVNGKVTGTVFAGDGVFVLNPPNRREAC